MNLRNITSNPYDYITKHNKEDIYISTVTTKPKLIISSDGFFYHQNGDIIKNPYLYERCEELLDRLRNIKIILICEYEKSPILKNYQLVDVEKINSIWDLKITIIDYVTELPMTFIAVKAILTNLTMTFSYIDNINFIEISKTCSFEGLCQMIRFQIQYRNGLNYFILRTRNSIDNYNTKNFDSICYIKTYEKKDKSFINYFKLADKHIK